jgi:hypothetical protein
MVFYSSRNALFDDNLNGELWLKDLKSGSETSIMEWGFLIIGWGAENELFVNRFETIERINLNTAQSEVLYEDVLSVGFSYPYLLHNDYANKLIATNLLTRKKKDIVLPSYDGIGYIRSLAGSPWAMVFYAQDRTKPERFIAIINLQTGEVKRLLQEAAHIIFTDGQVVEDNHILLGVRTKGQTEEVIYKIDIDRL